MTLISQNPQTGKGAIQNHSDPLKPQRFLYPHSLLFSLSPSASPHCPPCLSGLPRLTGEQPWPPAGCTLKFQVFCSGNIKDDTCPTSLTQWPGEVQPAQGLRVILHEAGFDQRLLSLLAPMPHIHFLGRCSGSVAAGRWQLRTTA